MGGGAILDLGCYLVSFSSLIAALQNADYEKIKINNISVIHLDEEGGIHAGNDDQIKETLDVRIDAKALDSDDYLFIWGEFQSKHYISKLHKNSGPKIINTDFVKFDFTKKN